ncbi:polysaccharide pyruvyl transferase family protein [Rhizobium sp. P32RR-XVIII]|uniref:polysaccharide pyruvyl transferase family protein n=1 Tax=Rhizobium sp. P32RR-XVIII TaxID=2726738 RepID=UPI0014569937|nr:polysaccharide pyruvyl transferase family protein [Rhizobium sp. P32RR-XVIII]NLS06760.1 polysaccharide pyruvyl transferase family protein [Rhizobium sp. P32RR-XVIII]
MSDSKAILINDTSTKPHLGCRLVVSQIVKLAASHGIQVVATSSVHTDWRTQSALQDEMRKADLVIVNGEGTLHHSSRQAKALADVGPFCRSAGVPSILVNSVYEENDDAIARACEAFDRIYVRESRSAHNARLAGLKVEVVPDLTLSSRAMSSYRSSSRGGSMVVTDNANSERNKQLLEHALRRRDASYLNLNTCEPSNPFLDKSARPFAVFMPDGVADEAPAPRQPQRIGYRAFRKSVFRPLMASRMAMIRDTTRFRPAADILTTIAEAKGLIAGRFHAACLSLMAGTPFASMASNTSKTRGMLEDAGLSQFLAGDPAAAFQLATSWREQDNIAAAAYVARAERDALEMFNDIASLAR